MSEQIIPSDAAVVDRIEDGTHAVLHVGPDEVELIVDVALLPSYRGRSLGARLIGDIQQQAAATGCIVSIHVEAHNPAQRLYERLGFVVAEDLGVYRRMEWTP